MQVTTSFRLNRKLLERFKELFPNRGDRSRVLARLVEKLLNGEVKIELAPKT